MVGKAEHLAKGANPRFVVTSCPAQTLDAQTLDAQTPYERVSCGRGEMGNRTKGQPLCLFADRTSCRTMRANRLRLWLASAADVLMNALREFGLRGTELGRARCDTTRLKVLEGA